MFARSENPHGVSTEFGMCGSILFAVIVALFALCFAVDLRKCFRKGRETSRRGDRI